MSERWVYIYIYILLKVTLGQVVVNILLKRNDWLPNIQVNLACTAKGREGNPIESGDKVTDQSLSVLRTSG